VLNINIYQAACQAPLRRQRADPAWAEGVQLSLGATLGYTRQKSYLRSCFIRINPQWGSPEIKEGPKHERRYRIFAAIKWVYDAPGIVRLAQTHLGWPTPNHLMTHYFRRYPHTSWWARAHQYALAGARKYNIRYLLKCLEGIAERARARVAELLEEGPSPGEDPALSYEDRLRLRLRGIFGGGEEGRGGDRSPREGRVALAATG